MQSDNLVPCNYCGRKFN